MDPSNLELEV